MDSSRRALGVFLLGGFALVLAIFLLLVEGAALASSLLRFRWDAGVVKNEDMMATDLSLALVGKMCKWSHCAVCVCKVLCKSMTPCTRMEPRNFLKNVSAAKSWHSR